jgi:hypothetical protein
VHRYAFSSLPKSLQDDMKLLHPEVEYDSSYFDEEEHLSSVMGGKTDLTEAEVKEVTNLIMNSISWDEREKMEARGLNFADMTFISYYAGIPLMFFAKKLAEVYGIDTNDEELLVMELGKTDDLQSELRKVITESIKTGLFVNDYVPLCNSETYETYSGKTKLKHKTIFKRWLEAKEKATDEVGSYIDDNHLVCAERTEEIAGISWTRNIITGDSLYYADESLPFVKEYREQVETLMSYGLMFQVLEVRDVSKEYGYLLKFKELADKVSKTIDQDASHFAEKYLDEIQKNIKQLNQYLYGIRDKMTETVSIDTNYTYSIEFFFNDLMIDLSELEPMSHKSLEVFEQRAKKHMKSEWPEN